MNSFHYQYLKIKLEDDFFASLRKALEPYTEYEECKTDNWDGETLQSKFSDIRSSKACFVDDPEVYRLVDGLVRFANAKCQWNLDVDFIEPLQLTKYEVGDFYGWHIDESNWTPGKRPKGKIRKISFSIALNDDYEGGEFHIGAEYLKEEMRLNKNEVILFLADTPHQVTPVTSGVRYSLVGWTQGPAYR